MLHGYHISTHPDNMAAGSTVRQGKVGHPLVPDVPELVFIVVDPNLDYQH